MTIHVPQAGYSQCVLYLKQGQQLTGAGIGNCHQAARHVHHSLRTAMRWSVQYGGIHARQSGVYVPDPAQMKLG